MTCTRCRPVDFEPAADSTPQMLPPPQLVEVGVASQPGWIQLDAINAIATQLSSGLPAAVRR